MLASIPGADGLVRKFGVLARVLDELTRRQPIKLSPYHAAPEAWPPEYNHPMIEFDVATRRKPVVTDLSEASRYLVLGDFGGRVTEPLAVDRDNFDDVLARLNVDLAGVRLRGLEDFHPDRLFQRFDIFRDFDPAPAEEPPAREASAPRADIEEILRPSSLLEQITGGGDPFQQYLRDLARAHAAPKAAENPQRTAALGERMRALLHHPRFQAIEAAWRGLDFVIRGSDDETARVHISQFSKQELIRDLAEASDLRATRAYGLMHSRRWQAVIGLYGFGGDASDIELLGRIALIAAHARAPFLTEGSADMGPHWQELRSIPEASYLGLALPRLLLRLPYGPHTSQVDAFEFEEMPGEPVHGRYLWGNPSLACLALLARGDGTLDLENLPAHTYKQEGEWKMTPCAEVYLTEPQVAALIDLGLMPLVSFKDSDRVRLAGFRAINSAVLPLPG
jgi:type VI secretion system protein ImpC